MENYGFTLCESTLRKNTRDVYGRDMPPGSWQYYVTHDGGESLNIEIKIQDDHSRQWSLVEAASVNNPSKSKPICGKFSTESGREVKFIFSSSTLDREINYRCELRQARQ